MSEHILELKLAVTDINLILRSLGKNPYEEVVVLIQKIKQQGESQLAQLEKETPEKIES